MPGHEPEFVVHLFYKGEELEVPWGVDWDWNDDDESTIRISFYAKSPFNQE